MWFWQNDLEREFQKNAVLESVEGFFNPFDFIAPTALIGDYHVSGRMPFILFFFTNNAEFVTKK